MPVTPVDLAAVAIGFLFAAVGVSAAAAAASSGLRANRSAVWFGVFCALYGVRLLASANAVQAATAWPPALFRHVDAAITYTILVPATLFVESLAGPAWRTLLHRTSQALAIFAAGAILADAITGRPFAASRLNTVLVAMAVAVWFVSFAAGGRKRTWSVPVRIVTAAGALLAATAIVETVSDGSVLGAVDPEPLAMLVFAAALGWLVLTRARNQSHSFAALSRELELARSIQQSLLPQQLPQPAGLHVEAAYLPMSAVAGDFYEALPLSGGRLLVLVADVSGHGVPAALVASMVKVAVAAEADRSDRPGDVLTGINRTLTGKFERAYVTACCVVIDPQRNSLAYAAAGHPPPLLRRADSRLERLTDGGIVLTLLPAATYTTADVTFEPGDRLLLYTDGLSEAPFAKSDEFFGDAELARVVAAVPASSSLLSVVLDAHRRWIGDGTPLSDDVSAVAIERV